MKKRIGLTLTLLMLCHQAQSEQVAVFGAQDCGKWLKAPNKSWLMGFLSGMNNAIGTKAIDPLDELGSAEQAYLWVDNYCKANPLNTAADAAGALYFELQAKAIKKK